MLTMNPMVLLGVGGIIAAATYYAYLDLQKHLPRNERGFTLQRLSNDTLDIDSLIKSEEISPGALASAQKSLGRIKNYRRYSQEEVMPYSGANILDRVRIILRKHLNRNYNLLNATEYLVLCLMGLVAGAALGFWLIPNIWGLGTVGLIGLITAEVYLGYEVRKYRAEINRESIVLTQLVIQGMRTGISIGDAFELSAQQLQGSIGKEINVMMEYFHGGFSFPEACEKARLETASSFLKKIYQIIIMSMETRISPDKLIERLSIVRKNLIVEYYLKQSMKAEAGGGIMAKNLLIVIVPGLLIMVLKQSPVMLMPLLDFPAGWIAIAAGIGLYFGGIQVANKALKKLE
jgi:Flp pilus assembly protein TadB